MWVGVMGTPSCLKRSSRVSKESFNSSGGWGVTTSVPSEWGAWRSVSTSSNLFLPLFFSVYAILIQFCNVLIFGKAIPLFVDPHQKILRIPVSYLFLVSWWDWYICSKQFQCGWWWRLIQFLCFWRDSPLMTLSNHRLLPGWDHNPVRFHTHKRNQCPECPRIWIIHCVNVATVYADVVSEVQRIFLHVIQKNSLAKSSGVLLALKSVTPCHTILVFQSFLWFTHVTCLY